MALCLATSTTASSLALFTRQDTCVTANYDQCSQAGLPAGFCCPVGQTCIALAAETTVLCCPAGSECSIIKSITCDIQQQNATARPDNLLKTIALDSSLPKCGTECCPFGYTCNSAGNCALNTDQSVAPAGFVASPSSTTSSPSSTAAPTTTSTSVPSTNSAIPIPVTKSCNKFPVGAVLAGFFPGLALGIILTVASICILGAQRRKAARKSGSSFGNISEPQPTNYTRTDFLRKQPQTPSTDAGSTPQRENTVQRVRSLFRKSTAAPVGLPISPRPAPPVPLNVQRPSMSQSDRPVTPAAQREPSFENINIWTDGDTASSLRGRENVGGGLKPAFVDSRASHQTTWNDMMESSGLAGLQKGQRKSQQFLPPIKTSGAARDSWVPSLPSPTPSDNSWSSQVSSPVCPVEPDIGDSRVSSPTISVYHPPRQDWKHNNC